MTRKYEDGQIQNKSVSCKKISMSTWQRGANRKTPVKEHRLWSFNDFCLDTGCSDWPLNFSNSVTDLLPYVNVSVFSSVTKPFRLIYLDKVKRADYKHKIKEQETGKKMWNHPKWPSVAAQREWFKIENKLLQVQLSSCSKCQTKEVKTDFGPCIQVLCVTEDGDFRCCALLPPTGG